MSRSRGAECVVFGRGNTLLREKHVFLRREKRSCGRNAPAGHFLKKVPRPLKNFMGISLARAYAPLPCKEAGCLRRGDHRSLAVPSITAALRKPLPVGATIGRSRCLRHTTASENLCRRPRSPALPTVAIPVLRPRGSSLGLYIRGVLSFSVCPRARAGA